MPFQDVRGNPCSSSHPTARAAAELALWRMMSFYEPPLADLDAATVADPGWCLPHIMKAGFLLSLAEPALVAEAEAHLSRSRELLAHATAREKGHLEAVQAVLEGRWQQASRMWEDLLVEHPRDALALQWAHLWDFYRGDAFALRNKPARALPEWDEADQLFPHVLALHAFGLEECNFHAQAEDTARRALQLDPRLPWAVHAVAHVMEMQGRFEDGAAWLRAQQTVWADGNGFAAHLWWHKALFRLEAMDLEGVLRLVDLHLSGAALHITLNRIDAVSILWRLRLLGEDVTAQFADLLGDWCLDTDQAGYYAFNDVHAVMALLGAEQAQRAETWLARCAQRALSPADAGRTNHLISREIGLPLMRGVIALEKGDADGAADTIAPVRATASRLGGSHAQRDLIDQSLLAATALGGRRSLGRALLNERQMAKPLTPLTRHWISRHFQPPQERA